MVSFTDKPTDRVWCSNSGSSRKSGALIMTLTSKNEIFQKQEGGSKDNSSEFNATERNFRETLTVVLFSFFN